MTQEVGYFKQQQALRTKAKEDERGPVVAAVDVIRGLSIGISQRRALLRGALTYMTRPQNAGLVSSPHLAEVSTNGQGINRDLDRALFASLGFSRPVPTTGQPTADSALIADDYINAPEDVPDSLRVVSPGPDGSYEDALLTESAAVTNHFATEIRNLHVPNEGTEYS